MGGTPPLNGKIPLSRFLKGSLNSWSILLIFEDILLIFRDLLLILGDILLIFEDILSFFGGRHFIGGISLILGGRQFIGGILLIFGDILLITSYLVVKANTNQIRQGFTSGCLFYLSNNFLLTFINCHLVATVLALAPSQYQVLSSSSSPLALAVDVEAVGVSLDSGHT